MAADSPRLATRGRLRRAEAASVCVLGAALLGAPATLLAQAQNAAPTPRSAPAFDMTGYWVSVVTEDWRFRMVTPARGEYAGIPLNAEGRRVAEAWEPAADSAAAEACRAYGAAAIMRMPGRLHVTWEDDDTLRIDTDAGNQTRLLEFGDVPAPSGALTRQGHSRAQWRHAAVPPPAGETRAGAGSLAVVTTQMRAGYLRRNGVPYSDESMLTEYFNYLRAPNGDEWLVVSTRVEDPVYLERPYVTSTHFKKLPDAMGWNPTPCSAR